MRPNDGFGDEDLWQEFFDALLVRAKKDREDKE